MSGAALLTHDNDGLVYACPNCNTSGSAYRRRADNTHADDPDKPYYCYECKSAFEDPVERPPKTRGTKPLGHDLSPEDVGL